MPDDWVKRTEDGDWVTVRSSLSGVLAIMGGWLLAEGVGRGVNGRVAADAHEAATILRNEIDEAHSVEKLLKLKHDFEVATNDGARTLSKRHNDIYAKIDELLPYPNQERNEFLEAVAQINNRLRMLKSMGVDVQE